MRIHQILIILILLLAVFSKCKKEDIGPELIARTGPDTTSSIGDTVWLDASASSGSDYEIQWTFQSHPGDDTITYSDSDSAFFIPMYNGSYQVLLTITKGSLFNFDYQNLVVSGPVLLDSEISTATRLKKIAGINESDYIAISEVLVSNELILEPGVIIEFTKDASLVIDDGGEIYADNVSFIAAESDWKGICVKTVGNSFANCLIDNAGNASFTDNPNDKAGIIMMGGATMAFSGNTLSSSGGYGLVSINQARFFEDTENQVYAYRNNRFIKNELGPMAISVHVLGDLSGQYFEEETAGTYIEIYGSSYPASASKNPWLSNQGMAYKVTGVIEFNKDFTINSGVEMYFEEDAGIKVNGKLTVSGTSAAPVVMNGISSLPASWLGIYVLNGQVDLSYLSLLNAGKTAFTGINEKASLIVEKLLSMKNSTISGSGGIGLYMPGDAHVQYTENFTGNTIENNITSAIRIRMDDVGKVVSGNTIRTPSSSVPAVEIHMGLDDHLGTWVNLEGEYDYKILESLTIKSSKDLVIEAGATLKMTVGSTLEVSGGLQAKGSAGSQISFEGTESKKGHWDGIFLKGTHKIELDYLVVRDGGGGLLDKANMTVESTATDVSLSNSSITNSKGYGVLVKSMASDFGINDAAANNTLEGDLGGFHKESK